MQNTARRSLLSTARVSFKALKLSSEIQTLMIPDINKKAIDQWRTVCRFS